MGNPQQGDKTPQAEYARVPREKITLYLLSLEHPHGKSKARFFIGQGFLPARWQELADALREHVKMHPAAKTENRSNGLAYIVEGELHTPSGKRPYVRSVWIVERNKPPRLVTAYPIRRPNHD